MTTTRMTTNRRKNNITNIEVIARRSKTDVAILADELKKIEKSVDTDLKTDAE